MMDFFHTGRKLFFTSSVYDMYLSAKAERCSGSIHSHVSAAYDSNLFPAHDRRFGIFAESLHQVASCQIFIGGKYTVGIFSGNSHEFGKSCSGTDKYCGKSFFRKKFVNSYRFSNNNVCLNSNSQRFYVLDFLLNHILLGKTELGNTINQNTAGLMKSFKNSNLITHFCKITRTGKACRAGSYNGNFFPFFLFCAFRLNVIFCCPVGYKTFQLTDGDRLSLNSPDTFSLTLAFLRAYTAAHRGKG